MSRKHKSERPEILSRNVAISSFSASVRLHAVHPRGEKPYVESQPWLELRGEATEMVRDVRSVKISMFPRDTQEVGTATPASVGAIIQVRPELDFVLTWPQVDFDRVWTLAISDRLTHAHLIFTKPYRNSGLVVNASFSTEAEE
jgi:hypothetical protein